MAYSNQRVVSDGTLVTLAISISYLDRTEIAVLFDGIADTSKWAWVGTSDKTILFNPAVANGVVVTVQRTTNIASIRNNYVGGAAFNYQSIDDNFMQILQIAQEAREVSQVAEIFNDLNMHGNKIRNVADGVLDSDVANMRQINTAITTTLAIKADVEAVYDSFDDRYLGAKTTAPTTDNDGNTLQEGALYWNSADNTLYTWGARLANWYPAGGGGGQMFGHAANKAVSYNSNTINEPIVIPTGSNGYSAGPIEFGPDGSLDISDGATWSII